MPTAISRNESYFHPNLYILNVITIMEQNI